MRIIATVMVMFGNDKQFYDYIHAIYYRTSILINRTWISNYVNNVLAYWSIWMWIQNYDILSGPYVQLEQLLKQQLVTYHSTHYDSQFDAVWNQIALPKLHNYSEYFAPSSTSSILTKTISHRCVYYKTFRVFRVSGFQRNFRANYLNYYGC